MCTLIVNYSQTNRGAHLWIGANRDEELARPSTLPALDRHEDTAIFAPRDSLAGGTWIGLNEHGVVAAITNRFGLKRRPTHRSRGLVVLDALKETTAANAAERIGAISADEHNGFHLLIADRNDVFLVWNDGESVHTERLKPGVHVLTERSLDAGDSERPIWLACEIERLRAEGTLIESELMKLLQYQNEQAPLEGTCVHMPGGIYGTRSSTIIELSHDGLSFLHAQGAPCVTPYVDLSGDARQLFERS